MCGICGKININNINTNDDLLRRMCAALKHRGPDDEGIYIPELKNKNSKIKIGLGHRRLSIIDLSEAGHQPMSNEDGSVWIVFNGEIYNYPELREILEKKGHKFKSSTDTEAILHLYEEKGQDCLHDLRGMFAFAIWDEGQEKLFLARDRLGKKPLFYHFKNGSLSFASELNALLQDAAISRDIDLASIDDFLNYQYIPAPFTIFKEAKKLPPAHFLIWKDSRIKIERYWSLDYSKKLSLKESGYCERILELLEESTRIRMISDVPLGAFLSGGIDSSAVVAMMARLSGRQVKTFSISFQEKSFNEAPFARMVSARFGTQHREFVVKADALSILPELITHFGEPYADSSAIPTYYLSKMVREDVTVALNGDGADESFGGYERYVADKIAARCRPAFVLFDKLLGRVVRSIPETINKKDTANRAKRFLSAAAQAGQERYPKLMSLFDSAQRARIYSEGMKAELKSAGRANAILNEYMACNSGSPTDSALFADLMTYMPGDLLPKVDITSMANSLEARSPFLDHKFLEFSAQIPHSLKINGLVTKYILKKALKDVLPAEILKRRKMGFAVPVGKWFRNELKNYAYQVLTSAQSANRGYFDKGAVKAVLDEHCRGNVNNGARIWCLLNLELWHRAFVDR